MARDAFWLLFGAFVGFDIAMAYALKLIKRARSITLLNDVVARVKPYVGQRGWPW